MHRIRPPSVAPRGLEPGSPVVVEHTKPWSGKRPITMQGVVAGWSDGLLTIARRFAPHGFYDTLGAPKLPGDHGIIEVPAGGWVLRREYRRQDGTLVGELFNVQTPVQLRPGVARYIDLEVDVVRFADGRVEVVDEEDLAAAVACGGIAPDLAEKARAIAHRLADLLRTGGDWRAADAAYR